MKPPYGAIEIIKLRKAGKCPAEMILLSLVGTLHEEANPVVVLTNPDSDLRFLHDLEVMLVCSLETPVDLINRVSEDLMAVKPAYAGIWWRDKGDGINLCWGSYRPKAKCMRRWFASERAAYATNS